MNVCSQMPRPPSVTNAALLRAAAQVIGRRGPVEFTIREVADQAGLSAAAVMQRFRTKRGLLLALLEHAVAGVEARFKHALTVEASPLRALRRALREDAAELGHPTEAANHLTFLAMELRDEELRRHTQEHFAATERLLRQLLKDARARGEVPEDTDVARLARSVHAAYHGTLLLWTVERKGRPEDAVAAAVDALLPGAA